MSVAYRLTCRPTIRQSLLVDVSANISVKCRSTDARPICRSICRPTHLGRHIERLLTDMSVDISTDTRPICRPIHRSRVGRYVNRYIGRGVHKIHMIPSNKGFIMQQAKWLCPWRRTSRIFIYGGMRGRSMRSGTKLAREIQLTDWSTAGNLSNQSSGVQIPCDICTRFGRYLYSTKCSWIIKYTSSLTINFPELQPMSRVTARQSSLWMSSPWRNSRPVPWPKYLNTKLDIEE